MNASVFRYEYKYIIDTKSAMLLRYKLGAIMQQDTHSEADGSYFVRSIYFDDDSLTSYHDKLNGVRIRNKYRLRYYNMNDSYFVYEAKRKRDLLVTKESVSISRSLAESMLKDEQMNEAARNEELLKEFVARRTQGAMKPVVIVDYQRIAFTYPLDNIRVTLDYGVCSGLYCYKSVFSRFATVPVMEKNHVVLEIKFARSLPPYIAKTISEVPKILCANSKYCSCLAVYL